LHRSLTNDGTSSCLTKTRPLLHNNICIYDDTFIVVIKTLVVIKTDK